MQTMPFEEAIARKFRLKRAPTLFARQEAAAPIAFSRLRNQGTCRERTLPAPPEEAFSFLVALAPVAGGEIWIDGQYAKLPATSAGGIFVFNLAASTVANLRPPYDFLRFYLPVATLDQLAHDRGLRRMSGLRTTLGSQDPVMHGLALSLLAMVDEPGMASEAFADSIALAFHSHVMRDYGHFVMTDSSAGAGLAPWQLRRAHAFIEAHLGSDPSVCDMARECRLSASHFGRAFRQAMGMPPHQWLTKRRIERAKDLLRQGNIQLAQIALVCGFVDQSHLSRTFTRYEGYAPGKWRRLCCG